ncbi:uncharacterized protein LOC112505906 [Cynara cardunculus var. scolymus]|uniref:uncharacterized protein LOC112505906 n=1 Tax=Cynara cardunculus var. scolymus TaxID=59895 RepID=UPI000D626E0D|nr:uncharacterized protein LOC112505906 [Cynara cardunculus var. scolymus]
MAIHTGFFMGEGGLRQGDLLSPYLFTIVMEGFSMLLKQCIQEAVDLWYHRGCDDLDLTHLCFTNDLFVFTKGDVQSVEVLKKTLFLFQNRSGLEPSLEKSEIFFGNVSPNIKEAIIECLPFKLGSFLFRKFVWAPREDPRGRCRLSWEVVCRPLASGGLGIRCLATWNRALLAKHIWDIVRHRNSLWVRWVYQNNLPLLDHSEKLLLVVGFA